MPTIESFFPSRKNRRCNDSPPKARHHPPVEFPRHAHIVEVVFATLQELPGLIEVEDAAAFDVCGLAGFKPQCPGDVVEADATPAIAQLPGAHRVENSPNIVFAEVHERSGRNIVRETALKDEGQIETNDVMSDKFIAFDVEIRHQREKVFERLSFALFVAFFVYAECMFAWITYQAFNLESWNLPNVNSN